ncbi:glycoside hydrolase family 140 protein [Zunongwangia endophytica]|uniref:Glycoside hydrolase family 140 protein n=1 Tax=Zunongwangia endophytica TaxID=1808945 RepID=A0ABV8H8S9_9FLAO|nr:glycoside hydrolase family 140 protein [Zunongwangia endophytica]MDN3594827.1 glycoside hydrolase family 140 protein [Zunongwangia endophytica]
MLKLTHYKLYTFFSIFILLSSCKNSENKKTEIVENEKDSFGALSISENQRYFQKENGDPFFWLGDTGWLMFNKLDRDEIKLYIEDRKAKDFNVIQAMVLHTLEASNVYQDSALVNKNVAEPLLTEGAEVSDSLEYDFWDHVDYAVKTAEENNIYMALVPVWGGNIKNVNEDQARKYGKFLAERYKDYKNVIWLNGGDTFGNEYTNVWNALGESLDEYNPDKLITFHPRGRHDSSDWFHDATWLDFNMFQSGHRTYDQDDSERKYGEDNWKYVKTDYNLKPIKPTLDGEPSYEGIPYGLHDTLQPFWKDHEIRRYAYWSVFAGAAGFTYGHSAVMQMHRPEDKTGAYGNKKYWEVALNDPGAKQMQYLKKLMLNYSYFDRKPDSLIVLNSGERYNYLTATSGKDYAMVYTYNGKNIEIDAEKLSFDEFEAYWFDPRNGEKSIIQHKSSAKEDIFIFDPEGEQKEGNDWVLILEKKV